MVRLKWILNWKGEFEIVSRCLDHGLVVGCYVHGNEPSVSIGIISGRLVSR